MVYAWKREIGREKKEKEEKREKERGREREVKGLKKKSRFKLAVAAVLVHQVNKHYLFKLEHFVPKFLYS